jgi:hypothetical protein
MKPFLNTVFPALPVRAGLIKQVHGMFCDITSYLTRFILLFVINVVSPLQLSRTSVPFLKPEAMTTSIPDYMNDFWRYCLHVKVRK